MTKNKGKKRRKALHERQKGTCAGPCNRVLDLNNKKWTIDHIQETQFGGDNNLDNLALLCDECHAWKNQMIAKNKPGLQPCSENTEEDALLDKKTPQECCALM